MNTLFPMPDKPPERGKKGRKPPEVEDGKAFRFEPYAWLYGAIHGKASHFPITRWVKPLKQVETQTGKITSLRGWACYLINTEARYVSAWRFAQTAGQWVRQAPDCGNVFRTQEEVEEYFGQEEKIEVPPHIVSQGMTAIKNWLDKVKGA